MTDLSPTRSVKLRRPTNCGGLMMSHENSDSTNVETIGRAVKIRIASADREIISQPKVASWRAARARV
jgi:hypothetical protein